MLQLDLRLLDEDLSHSLKDDVEVLTWIALHVHQLSSLAELELDQLADVPDGFVGQQRVVGLVFKQLDSLDQWVDVLDVVVGPLCLVLLEYVDDLLQVLFAEIV